VSVKNVRFKIPLHSHCGFLLLQSGKRHFCFVVVIVSLIQYLHLHLFVSEKLNASFAHYSMKNEE
jgi:hypothetical protein